MKNYLNIILVLFTGKKNQKNSRFMFVVYGVLAPSEKNLPLTVFNFTVRLAIHGGALSRK